MGGIPKGLEQVGGARIVDRVVSALREVTPDIAVSGAELAREWRVSDLVVLDKTSLGGMSGVHAALTSGRDVLAVAWDMPFVSGPLLRHLLKLGASASPLAVVPESDSPHGLEPFCAWYSRRALHVFDRFLSDGGGAARDLIARLADVVLVPRDDVLQFGDPATLFFSVNTPADLERARAIAAGAR